jgi:hypothetical protein
MNSRRLATVFAAGYLLSTATARGDFTTVINSPPDVISRGSIFGANTQINLFHGTYANVGKVLFLGGPDAPAENAQLNVLGGSVWAVEAWTGSQLNVVAGSINTANLLGARGTMSGGVVKSWAMFAKSHLEMSGGVASLIATAGSVDGPDPDTSHFVMSGGEVGVLDATGNVVIQGGMVDNMFFRGTGFVVLSGGSIGDDFEVGSVVSGSLPDDSTREIVVGNSGRVTVRGGSIGNRMILRNRRTLDYSGGVIGDEFQALDGSHVNIRGSHFLIDGVELTWAAGEKVVLAQRDIALEGVLADRQPFRFDLNSEPGFGDYFSPDAMVSIMVVPEPRTEFAAILLTFSLAATIRIRKNHGEVNYRVTQVVDFNSSHLSQA